MRRKRTHAAAKQNRGSPEPSRALADHFGYAETTAEDGSVMVARAGWRVADITTERVDEFLAARRASGVKLDTAQADLRWLRHAFNLLVEDKRLARDQCPTIKTHDPKNARQGFFEADQFAAVASKLPEYLRNLVTFAYLTGWRVRSEVLPLTWARVDWRAGVVRLDPGTTKNGDGREFPFAALLVLKQLLERQLAGGEPVSAHTVFYEPTGRQVDYKHLRLAWRKACKQAKVPGRILHDLRRTAVRNLVRAGVAQVVAMTLTGHKTAAVFHRYAIIDTNLQAEGVAKLAAALATAQRSDG